ncbi:MAG: hypothetical protein FRX49_05683 [Trebouxia sp. A1-2]|nr:MAG: hypothetical protein FRX49_05683 [Trebouxia sp. A1-2]
MSNVPFSQRLGAFKQRFQQVLGNRGSGYDELAQLEQPLVGDDSSYGGGDDYQRSHGVSAPGQYSGFGSGMGGGTGGMSAGSALPSHGDELQLLAGLASDAAGLLWELAAMHDTGDAATDMLTKSEQLQAQLRGMMSDFTDADESAIAAALGAFETLTNSLDEFKKSTGGGAQEPQLPASTRTSTASAGGPVRLQPPPGGSGSQAPGQKPADEAPLISFD